jgi:hypothetical protein
MSADLEQLEAKLAELKGERSAVDVTLTKEGLVAKVGEYLQVARSHAAGSSRLALGGRAAGLDLEAVLAEDLLADDGLAGRVVKRLEAQGFGALSDRQKGSKLKALDEKIAKAAGELREAHKREALERVEAEFAGEAA